MEIENKNHKNLVPPEFTEALKPLENAPWKEILSEIAKRSAEMTAGIREALNSPAYTNLMESLHSISEAYTKQFGEIIKVTSTISLRMGEIIAHTSDVLSDIVKNIHIPEISEEHKERLISAHKQWGSYGWTIIPYAEMDFFDSCPDSLKEANKKALAICTNKNMQALSQDTLQMARVKISDYREAVDNFNDKRYKSCAMILFALIDSLLIRMQPKNENRKTGDKAARKIQKRINEEESIKGLLMTMYFANIFSALDSMFEGANDFRTQPELINRNFLDHGMLHRNVKRMDCVKLFLLYYNLLEFEDLIK